ncbi:MAG: CDP-glucose 4,6-dehydratase [Syntrophomonadaceae bacterium]
MDSMIFNNVYAGKKVLVTGHTGFKGTWLSIWLKALGAEVIGYALPPDTNPSVFKVTELAGKITHLEADIRDPKEIAKVVEAYRPEIVFHLAAQPLVRRSYELPHLTYETNIMGTVNLLEAVRTHRSVKACTVITSDKCYDNREWEYAYRENDPLGGFDPYSSSKAGAELVVASYQKSFFSPENNAHHKTILASARAGNVTGGGDWAADRIVPDVVKSLAAKQIIRVRNPQAIRPWQHVLEPLAGYLWLTALMLEKGAGLGSAWNFGPQPSDCLTVSQLVEKIIALWGSGEWQDISENDKHKVHEANYLKLDCTKAQSILGWSPVYRMEDALEATVEWYRQYYCNSGIDIYDLILSQIDAYVLRAHTMSLKWAGKANNES